jgi:outer membrane protein TolC
MLENNSLRRRWPAAVRLSLAAIAIVVLAVGTAPAQVSSPATPENALGTPAIPLPGLFGGGLPPSTTSVGSRVWRGTAAPVFQPVAATPTQSNQVRSDGTRQRITLEQVKQQPVVDPSSNPLAHLGELSIEAAKQHRLGAQADYFPKIGTTVANMHFSEFLGQVVSIRRPLAGSVSQVAVPLFSQNFTVVAVTFVQPITPLFQVYQVVKIARADERIAMAKAGVPIAKNIRDTQLEETYFKLLIAQRKLATAELKLRRAETGPLYASASIQSVRAPVPDAELVDVKKAVAAEGAEVKELTASLNRVMGWPDDTELELVPPDPLIENISLEEVAEKPLGANPEVIEAEQTAVKARAAAVLSRLAYMPTVAAMGGYIYQNAVPLVPSNFGYGGVLVSYNLFDFGKRERAVKEAAAQRGMAEIGVELTKAKVAGNVKKAYFELERSRQLSQVTQQMGSSMTRLINVSSSPESIDVKEVRAKVETELFEADLAHRQSYARLKALMGPQ